MRLSREFGFTLVELLVATGIMTIMLLVAWQFLPFAVRSAEWSRSRDAVETLANAWDRHLSASSATQAFGSIQGASLTSTPQAFTGVLAYSYDASAGFRAFDTSANLLAQVYLSNELGEFIAPGTDGFGTQLRVFQPARASINRGDGSVMFARDTVVVSAGANRQFEITFDSVTGEVTASGDDVVKRLDGHEYVQRFRDQAELALNQLASRFQTYFTQRRSLDPGSSPLRNYFHFCPLAAHCDPSAGSAWTLVNGWTLLTPATSDIRTQLLGLSPKDVSVRGGEGVWVATSHAGSGARDVPWSGLYSVMLVVPGPFRTQCEGILYTGVCRSVMSRNPF